VKSFLQQFTKNSTYQSLLKHLQTKENAEVTGLAGASLSIVIANLFNTVHRPLLVLLPDKEESAYILNDLETLVGEQQVLFFPDSYRRPYQIEDTDNANVLLRAEVLNQLSHSTKPLLIVSYPEALFEKVITRKQLEKNTLKIQKGDSLTIDFLNEVLFSYHFNRTDFVTEPGEFSVRGGIVDVFSFSNNEPYRIEFFGNEVDSIRTFDVESQLSTAQLSKITIIPNVENKESDEIRQSFLEYISEQTLFISKDMGFFDAKIEKLFAKATDIYQKLPNEVKRTPPEELYCQATDLLKQIQRFQQVNINATTPASKNKKEFSFHTTPQPSFNKQFELLISYFNNKHEEGFQNYILCGSEQQAKRFQDIFEEMEQKVPYQTVQLSLHAGFVDTELKYNVFTDHQIFERYYKFQLKNGYAKKQAITLKELMQLEVGDYVTHIDHGIGKFVGLQKIEVEGVRVKIIHTAVGAINESDITLATASNAIIIGFNVRPTPQAKIQAESDQVDIRLHRIIYNVIDEIETAMKGMLDPEFEEKITGQAIVRETYTVSKLGTIAGSYVLEGVVKRSSSVRLIRDNIVIYEGELASLKRFKDDAKEVKLGFECGIMIDGYNDIKVDDIIEAYEMVEIKRK